MGGVKMATLMCTMVHDGDVAVLRRVLRSKADPDLADYNGCTPLHMACATGNLTIVSRGLGRTWRPKATTACG